MLFLFISIHFFYIYAFAEDGSMNWVKTFNLYYWT